MTTEESLRLMGVDPPAGIDPADLYRTLTKGGYLCTIPEGVSEAGAHAEMEARGKVLQLWVWRHYPERVRIVGCSTEGRRRLVLNALSTPKPPPPPPPRYIIYLDGCCEPNPSNNMGIGVHSDDAEIHISERVDQYGSNNVAECLAAIRALEECRYRNLTSVRLLSDSQFLVGWIGGSYQLRSTTARTYVPKIQGLLREVDGSIGWIPGTVNLADGPSRTAIGASTTEQIAATDSLQRIIETPIDRLKFRDFARLKSGRDRYSAMRLPLLREAVDEHQAVTEVFADDTEAEAKCLRWFLRGLDAAKAIRKVKTDREITANVLRSHRQDEEDQWPL